MGHYRVNAGFIVPGNDIAARIAVIGNDGPVTIYLPRWGNRRSVSVVQCSRYPITVDCNSLDYFLAESQNYSTFVIDGCEENMGVTFKIVGLRSKWIVTNANNPHTNFEGLKCLDTPSIN